MVKNRILLAITILSLYSLPLQGNAELIKKRKISQLDEPIESTAKRQKITMSDTGRTQDLNAILFEILNKDQIERKDVQEVNKLLERSADPNAANESGIPVLLTAAKRGYYDVAKLLIDKGADINFHNKNKEGGFTALHFAVLQGRPENVRLLLENGAYPELEDSDGYTSFETAFISLQEDVLAEFFVQELVNAVKNSDLKSIQKDELAQKISDLIAIMIDMCKKNLYQG